MANLSLIWCHMWFPEILKEWSLRGDSGVKSEHCWIWPNSHSPKYIFSVHWCVFTRLTFTFTVEIAARLGLTGSGVDGDGQCYLLPSSGPGNQSIIYVRLVLDQLDDIYTGEIVLQVSMERSSVFQVLCHLSNFLLSFFIWK